MTLLTISLESNLARIAEKYGAFERYDFERRRSTMQICAQDIGIALGSINVEKLPKEVSLMQTVFKIPFERFGYIDFFWYSTQPIEGVIGLSTDEAMLPEARQKLAKLLRELVQKNDTYEFI